MFIYNWKVIIKTKLSELMNLALDEYIFKLSQNESTQKNIQIDKGYYQKLLCSIISFINKVLNVQQYKNNYTDAEEQNIHARGNIGVTTTQQMAEQEITLRPKLNIYEYIAESFKHEFCVMMY